MLQGFIQREERDVSRLEDRLGKGHAPQVGGAEHAHRIDDLRAAPPGCGLRSKGMSVAQTSASLSAATANARRITRERRGHGGTPRVDEPG